MAFPWHLAMAPYQMARPIRQRAHSPPQQWHRAMAPRPVKVCHNHPPPIASCNGSQQWHPIKWHPAMAPSNCTLPHATLPWHPAMAPAYQMAPSTQEWHLTTWHPAMAPYLSNGTLPSHLNHMAPSNGTQQRHHVQSANVCTHPMAPSNGTLPCPPPTCTPTPPSYWK